MVQRVQSILLILVTILHVLMFFIPVFVWEGHIDQEGQILGLKAMTALYNLPFTIINALIILFSIFIIFQFKNLKKQRSYTYILFFIIIINITLYSYYLMRITVANEYVFLPVRSFGMFGQLLSLILCFFAVKRMKKDEDLVKSIDRIR